MSDLEELQNRIRQARSDGIGEAPPPAPDSGKEDSASTNSALRVIGDLIGTPVVCGALGMGIDNWLDTSPFGFIILAFLGLLAGFWGLYKMSSGSGSQVGFKQLQTGKKVGKKAQLFRDNTGQ